MKTERTLSQRLLVNSIEIGGRADFPPAYALVLRYVFWFMAGVFVCWVLR